MRAKKTHVVVECESLGERSLEFSHAENLLRLKGKGGWHLPENSPFEFVGNALQRKSNKKGTDGA